MKDALLLDFDPPNAATGSGGVATGRLCDMTDCRRPLKVRQKRFCSPACRFAYWDLLHPRINRTPPEGQREGSILLAVLTLMKDGEWRTAHEIAEAVRAFPHSVSARLAEARKRGWEIESDAANGNSRRAHRFRLVKV